MTPFASPRHRLPRNAELSRYRNIRALDTKKKSGQRLIVRRHPLLDYRVSFFPREGSGAKFEKKKKTYKA